MRPQYLVGGTTLVGRGRWVKKFRIGAGAELVECLEPLAGGTVPKTRHTILNIYLIYLKYPVS